MANIWNTHPSHALPIFKHLRHFAAVHAAVQLYRLQFKFIAAQLTFGHIGFGDVLGDGEHIAALKQHIFWRHFVGVFI